MVLFIIFGTTGITMTKDQGQFFCPQCGDGNDFKHKRVRRFFTLYFIPLIPLDLMGEYIECSTCQGNDQGKEMVITAAYQIAAADGHVDDSEHQLLLQLAEQMNLSPAHLRGILAGLENPKIAD